jgi:hypothetical protein
MHAQIIFREAAACPLMGVKKRNTRCEQMFSAILQIADIRQRAPSGLPQIKLVDDRNAGMGNARGHRLGRSFGRGHERAG